MTKNMPIDENQIGTVLAKDINFKGTLTFTDSLMIKGTFEGDINSTGHLIVDQGATVRATIKSAIVTNFGNIEGNIETTEKLMLLEHANLKGDIKSPDILIESGCHFEGNCSMTKKDNNFSKPNNDTHSNKTDNNNNSNNKK